ncbi:gliding motility protein [Pedobacter sp. KR3-3]|uniref:Gliding motility protein n=1 Tax=Pedobacter albus TaxID=3113905 RepID=A0ABU7I9G3_9SPHI|nr:gliding motility protein [Pedobacter sp. KR3-3]MEE1945997.1 gliding motility protein [Pedobacter sp. KR3-3]
MNNYAKLSIKTILLGLSLVFLYACSTQKDNAANRSLQNLSARYNYIYNSNVLLGTYQEELAQTYKDNYDDFLSVYIAPEPIDYLSGASSATGDTKALDEIIKKAQTIISEKGLSNYIDEAYMLLGKANFYKGNFFIAKEYFDYTAKTYKKDKNTHLAALNWKARSLMQLHSNIQARETLDTVLLDLDSVKHNKAEPLATLAQMSINQHDYKKAITYLSQAIKESGQMQSRTRWPYILAQLYEHDKQYELSLRNYTKVENSNSPFEMYFNAKLSKIRINDILNDQTADRKMALLKLLKDDKNLDYTDQIYYEVAEDYLGDKNYNKAAEYYKLSAQKSIRNNYQKGLAYLKLADLNFKNLGNYVNAKLYYDSALSVLPKNYPNYESILKKGQNLEYLTERYQLISEQDTLQALARMPQEAREKKLNEMFEAKKETANAVAQTDNMGSFQPGLPTRQQSGGTFYFNNANTISKGFSDFRRRWGNRILEDNWRQSVKSSQQVTQQNQLAAIGNNTAPTDSTQKTQAQDKTARIKEYTALLPLTPEQLRKSDQQIIDAYFEIAGFYQQVIEDQAEAIKVYEQLLARYPQNNHRDAIYYSLYLAYANTDKAKSENYRNKVLSEFPNSVYAKTILDPNFSAKQNALDAEVNKSYNLVFASYEQKDFPKVITGVDETSQHFPGNSLQSQYDYLKSIAIGRTQNVDSLLNAFNGIIAKYPNDLLITPLVKDHIAYINAHLAAFKARKIALIDFDPTEPRFIAQQETVVAPQQAVNEPAKNNPVTPPAEKPAVAPPVVQPKSADLPPVKAEPENKPAVTPPVVDNLFSKAESKIYYYVIDVADMTVSVSSSRFGVGQFNRANYVGDGLKHQLLELEEDQLIYVGNFESLEDVQDYAKGITPLLPRIMKVPTSTYKGFYISKENFDKIKNRDTLNRYLEFFKNNY